MKTNALKLRTEFGPETRFELTPSPAVPYSHERETEFEQLQKRLLAARLEELWQPHLNSVVRRAANEAAALAWVTPYPLLFFPALFEEKTQEALRVIDRQIEVRLRSRELLAI